MALQLWRNALNAGETSSFAQPGRSDHCAALSAGAPGLTVSGTQAGAAAQGAQTGSAGQRRFASGAKGLLAQPASMTVTRAMPGTSNLVLVNWRFMVNLDTVRVLRFQSISTQFVMWIFIAEAGVALFLLLFIVWFTWPRKDRNGKE